ncbi:putative leucyl aminopeptidase [Plesiocystis pacifica SIR-1]|uniref:Putative leucyl aminopeptidase n=1 Tax=Plesiocystis pacifica SIR-1 TaxID=391625 RepID=A6GGJ4_9BACT|nr:putative leucyl aminopeptidase [Plesiocystis pacifica SIR-1]
MVGPEQVFGKKKFPKLLGKKLDALAVELAKDVSVGDLGGAAKTLTGSEPRQLAVGLLPNRVSRYNTPTRAESVRRVVASSAGGKGKLAIILVADEAEHILAHAVAIGRCFPQYSGKSKAPRGRRVQIFAVDRQGKPLAAPTGTAKVVQAVRDSAELVDMPPSELNPETFAAKARELLDGLKNVEITEIVGDELLENGCGGIHGVGRCALAAPRLVVATYTPARAAEEEVRHIALVGKGVTYDTGGLHLKPRGAMEGMKCDMGGAAAVLGAFRVLAQRGCAHKVSLLLCLAENAIGPASYKPDDILTLHSGKTVEINNTDAEGRLCLGDGVSWAARELEADTVFTAATLTGAQMVSTGLLHGALYCADEGLEAAMVAAGKRCGDLVHPLPFAPEFYRQEFSSVVADMCNSVRNRMNAQSACAGQFVYNHVADTGVRFAHLDLAGPAFPKDRGTGFGVAVLSETILGLDS